MFGASNIVKNIDKGIYVYSGYEIAFYVARSRRFGNGFARNLVIFGANNSSSPHIDNLKINFSVLGERPTDNVNLASVQQRKN